MQLLQKIVVENRYAGNGWNFEKTTKYIFELDQMQLEVGYFEHYLDDVFIKSVVELPVSYGCPTHCKFCATSFIESFRRLESDQMKELLDYIWAEQRLGEREYVLLSVTGTGDIYFNFPNVKKFLEGLTGYNNLFVTLSSCLWGKRTLQEIEDLSEKIRIRNVQVTCISDDQNILERIIPIYSQRKSNFNEVLKYIKTSAKKYYRINYVMICGVNDSYEDFQRFRDKIEQVKDKIVVRIAKLNKTGASERNNLYSADIEKMKQFKELLQSSNIKGYLFYACKNDYMNCGQLITETQQNN